MYWTRLYATRAPTVRDDAAEWATWIGPKSSEIQKLICYPAFLRPLLNEGLENFVIENN